MAVTDWRFRRWRLWFLALMTATPKLQPKRLLQAYPRQSSEREPASKGKQRQAEDGPTRYHQRRIGRWSMNISHAANLKGSGSF